MLGMLFSWLRRRNIKFKENYYKKKYWIHPSVRIGYETLIQCTALDIGSETYIQRFCSLTGDISIGNNCSIASGVNIRSETHWGEVKPIEIGNNVLIGCNSFIKEGVRIGDNVIIGANSMVTKNIPNGQVWGGVPARRIR